MRLAVINPLRNAVFGSNAPSLFGAGAAALPSIFGGTAGPEQAAAALAAQQSGGGGIAQQAGMLSSGSTITSAIGSSPFLTPGAMVSSTGTFGRLGLDGILNTQLVAPSLPLEGLSSTVGASNIAQVPGGVPGLTVANTVGGAAGVLGGAYGIYSGIEKGGIGGTIGAIGGAASMIGGASTLALGAGLLPSLAPTLAFLGPAGLIAGAVLAIAGSLLPGALPSSKAQAAKIDLSSGALTYEGNSKNFSQANRDEAEGFVRSIASLESAIQGKVGFGIGYEARVGVESGRNAGDPGKLYLGIGGPEESFTRDEAGAKALADRAAELLWTRFRESAASALGGGDPVLLGTIRQAQASIAAEQEVDALRQQLLALGETAAATETRLDKLRQVQALYGDVTEAQFQAAAQSAGGAIGSLASYAAGLSTGDANPGTVLDRLAAAQAQFDRTSAGALAGDASALGGLQGAAETYRTLLRATYGGGAGYADGFARIADVIGQVADRGADRWTQDFARAETDRLVDPLMAIRDGIAALRRDLALAAARPA